MSHASGDAHDTGAAAAAHVRQRQPSQPRGGTRSARTRSSSSSSSSSSNSSSNSSSSDNSSGHSGSGNGHNSGSGGGHSHMAVSVNPTEARRLNGTITSYGWQVLVITCVAQAIAALLLWPLTAWPFVTTTTAADAAAGPCSTITAYAHNQRVVTLIVTALCALALVLLPRLGGAYLFRRRRGWWIAAPVAILWHVHHTMALHEWMNDTAVGVPRAQSAVSACRSARPFLYHTARVNVYVVLACASAMALCVCFATGSYLFEAAKRGGSGRGKSTGAAAAQHAPEQQN